MKQPEPVRTTNIYENIPGDLPDELMEVLASKTGVLIERIVSRGHASGPDHWYDQDRDEYVILLKGSAALVFEGNENPVVMRPGDWINIPAHRRHRVAWTDPVQETVWLAVHF